MMNFIRTSIIGLVALALSGGFLSTVFASDDTPKHKVVIQVSTSDIQTQMIALNNAINVQKALGQDNVLVEVVAYGPGLTLLTKGDSKSTKRVPNLAMQDISFSACGNTMKKMGKQDGDLVDGVKVVQAGVLRIMQLQEQGYSYVRP